MNLRKIFRKSLLLAYCYRKLAMKSNICLLRASKFEENSKTKTSEASKIRVTTKRRCD